MREFKLQKINLVVLLVIAIYLFIQNKEVNGNIQFLQNELMYLRNDNNLQNSYMDISIGKVKKDIEEYLDMVVDYEISYQELDYKNNIVSSKIQVDLKEYTPNSQYYIQYKEVDGEEYKEEQVLETKRNRITSELSLSLEHNYHFHILEHTREGEWKVVNGQPIELSIYDELMSNRSQIVGSSNSESKERIFFSYDVINKTYGFIENEIENVILRLYFGDILVYEGDITHNIDGRTLYKDEGFSGGRVSVYSYAEGEGTDEDDYRTSKTYYATIHKKELIQNNKDLLFKIEGFSGIFQSKLTLTYSNGRKMDLEYN